MLVAEQPRKVGPTGSFSKHLFHYSPSNKKCRALTIPRTENQIRMLAPWVFHSCHPLVARGALLSVPFPVALLVSTSYSLICSTRILLLSPRSWSPNCLLRRKSRAVVRICKVSAPWSKWLQVIPVKDAFNLPSVTLPEFVWDTVGPTKPINSEGTTPTGLQLPCVLLV